MSIDKPYTTFRNGKYNGATSLDMCIGTIPCKPGDGVKNLPTVQSIGKCKKYIDSKEECEKAAALYNIAGGVTSHSTPWEPKGCSIHTQTQEKNVNVFFNSDTTTTESCSNAIPCICASTEPNRHIE